MNHELDRTHEAARISALHLLNLLDTPSEERFDRLTRLAKRLLNTPIALITLIDSDRQWFKSSQGLDIKQTPRSISFCSYAIEKEGITVVPDTHQNEQFKHNELVTHSPYIRFYAGCPIHAPGGEKIGTLCIIDITPRHPSDEDLALLQDIATLAEQEINFTYLNTTDELTGISNRRGLKALGTRALSQCERAGKNATLLFIDLDNFKQINDQFGHPQGDAMLKDFAQLIQNAFRDSDVFGRYGGDEFVVLLTNIEPHDTITIINRFAQLVSAYNKNSSHQIQYSLGFADYKKGQTLSDLVEQADSNMYAHKNGK